DGDEVEAAPVPPVVVGEADADEADALDGVDAHAELHAGVDAAVVGVPVADQDAVDGQQLLAPAGLEGGDVEGVEVDGGGTGQAGVAGGAVEQVAAIGTVVPEQAGWRGRAGRPVVVFPGNAAVVVEGAGHGRMDTFLGV